MTTKVIIIILVFTCLALAQIQPRPVRENEPQELQRDIRDVYDLVRMKIDNVVMDTVRQVMDSLGAVFDSSYESGGYPLRQSFRAGFLLIQSGRIHMDVDQTIDTIDFLDSFTANSSYAIVVTPAGFHDGGNDLLSIQTQQTTRVIVNKKSTDSRKLCWIAVGY